MSFESYSFYLSLKYPSLRPGQAGCKPILTLSCAYALTSLLINLDLLFTLKIYL